MDWTSILKELVYAVVVTTVPILVATISKFFMAKYEESKLNSENMVLRNTINDTVDLIYTVVTETTQTYVDSLKQSGSFDEAAQKEAFNRSKSKILSIMSTESKDLLSSVFTDLDAWMNAQIESSVKRLK